MGASRQEVKKKPLENPGCTFNKNFVTFCRRSLLRKKFANFFLHWKKLVFFAIISYLYIDIIIHPSLVPESNSKSSSVSVSPSQQVWWDAFQTKEKLSWMQQALSSFRKTILGSWITTFYPRPNVCNVYHPPFWYDWVAATTAWNKFKSFFSVFSPTGYVDMWIPSTCNAAVCQASM